MPATGTAAEDGPPPHTARPEIQQDKRQAGQINTVYRTQAGIASGSNPLKTP